MNLRLIYALILLLVLNGPAYAWGDSQGLGFPIKPAKASAHFVVTQSEPSLPNATVLDVSGVGDLTSFDITNNASTLLTFSGVPDSSGAVVVTVGLATGQTANRVVLTNGSGNVGLGQVDLSTAMVTGSLPQASVASLTSDLAAKQPLDQQLTDLAGISVAAGDIFVVNDAGTIVHLTGGSNSQVLTYDATGDPNVKWADASGGMSNPMTTAGDLITSSSGSTPDRIAAVASGQFLQAKGTSTKPAWSGYTLPTGVPTTGKILVSDGTNVVASTPTFPNASASSGKVIKSDGTNWVASTETYAAPGTSGNVLTSDGTNWTSAAPASSGSTIVARPYAIRQCVIASSSATAFTALGIEALAQAGPGGTAGLGNIDGAGHFIRCQTGTSTNNVAGFTSAAEVVQTVNGGRAYFHVYTGSPITNVRWMVGLTENTGTQIGAANPNACSNLSFRFDTSASDTNWQVLTNDSTSTGTTTDSGVACSSNTDYTFCIDYTDRTSVKFYIATGTGAMNLVATKTTQLPVSTTGLLIGVQAMTLNTTNKNCYCGAVRIDDN